MHLSKSEKYNVLYIIIRLDNIASYFLICYSLDTYRNGVFGIILPKKNLIMLFYMFVSFLTFGDPALFLTWIGPWVIYISLRLCMLIIRLHTQEARDIHSIWVDSMSATLAQHWTGIGWTSHVCCLSFIRCCWTNAGLMLVHRLRRWTNINPLTAKLFILNFHPLEVVSRWRDPQLQVSENYSDLTKRRSTLFKSCWLMSRFIFNLFKMWHLMW